MKTSIKILLGLLLTIFMIPTIVLMAIGYKIKKGDYKAYDEAAIWKRVDIGPGRFIKVSAPDKDVLECKLVLSDKPHYMVWPYGTGGDDSVTIRQQNDTLFISYADINAGSSENNRYRKSVEVFVSDWQQLQVEGANIIIDSSFGNTYADKHISLKNATLLFGKQDKEDDDNDGNKEITMMADTTSPFIANLTLHASNSKLVLNSDYSIKNIDLDFNRGELVIKKGFYVNAVSGYISTGSQLKVDGLTLGKMKSLQVK